MTTSNFKIWDEFNSTSGLGKTIIRAPFIGVSPKGKMTFSTTLVEGLKLTQDSRIIFVEGEDGSFFLCKTKDHGLLFTKKKDKQNFLTMSATKLSAYLAQKFGFERNLSRYGFTLKELPAAPRKRRQKMEMEESLID